MAHCSNPNNLAEVCNAILAYIKNHDLTIDDIMTYIKGPDFPLGGTVINQKAIKEAFATGKSSVSLKVRGDYEIDGNKVIFTSIPYRTYRNKIKEQLEQNIDEFDKVLEDFNDESNIGNNRLVFFAKDGQIKILLNKLFKLTDLQTSISYNMNFIVNGTPKLCSIKDLIQAYVVHQNNVMINIAKTDLEKAKAKEHILEGLLIALKDIENAIKLIRESNDKDDARKKLISYFKITEIQANAILDMKLSKLTKLDKNDLIKELEEVRLAIIEFDKIINNEIYRNEILSQKVIELRDKYGDERRTVITQIDDTPKEEKEIEFVEPEKCVVVMSEGGLIKRIPTSSFRIQKRNGKGIKTQDDITNAVIRTNTIDSLMIFSNKGKMYRLLVNDIPVGTNVSKGQLVKALINMEADEQPTIIYSIYRDTDANYVLFVTKNGLVKKTPLEEYIKTKKKTGIPAISLKENDELATVSLIKDEQLVLLTNNGMAIRFNSKEISPTSRATFGVKGINLADGDSVSSALVIRDINDDIAIFAESGLSKRISLKELPVQKRAGKGLTCYKGKIAASAMVNNKDQILVLGNHNSICISAEDIPVLNRFSMGNQIIKNDKILQVSKV